MSSDLANSIRRFASNYDRGILTPHEFVHLILDLFVAAEPSQEQLKAAFREVPDSIMSTMKTELHEFADADFYRESFRFGDARSDDEVHADALTRQKPLRRICGILTQLILAHDVHHKH